MIRNWMARLISWWHGRKIGDTIYVKASPFILGDMSHCLPSELWTEAGRNRLRYCVYKYNWNGFGWVRDGYHEFSREELTERLKHGQT